MKEGEKEGKGVEKNKWKIIDPSGPKMRIVYVLQNIFLSLTLSFSLSLSFI